MKGPFFYVEGTFGNLTGKEGKGVWFKSLIGGKGPTRLSSERGAGLVGSFTPPKLRALEKERKEFCSKANKSGGEDLNKKEGGIDHTAPRG